MFPIQRDRNDQPFIQWQQGDGTGGWKRAWIQHKMDPGKDWARTGRYLNVARTEGADSGPAGNATDFPIFNAALTDEQILEAFVASVCSITGCRI
jgi:hypothetical protein